MQFKKLSQKQLIEREKSRDEFALRLRVLTWTSSDSEQRALGEKSNFVALDKNQTNKTNSIDWFFRLNLLVQFSPENSTRQIANRAKLTPENSSPKKETKKMNPLTRTTQKTVMIHVTQVEVSKFQLEFDRWIESQNLPTNDPFELLNDELLNAEQRDRVWSFLYLLGETVQS